MPNELAQIGGIMASVEELSGDGRFPPGEEITIIVEVEKAEAVRSVLDEQGYVVRTDEPVTGDAQRFTFFFSEGEEDDDNRRALIDEFGTYGIDSIDFEEEDENDWDDEIDDFEEEPE